MSTRLATYEAADHRGNLGDFKGSILIHQSLRAVANEYGTHATHVPTACSDEIRLHKPKVQSSTGHGIVYVLTVEERRCGQ